MREVRSKLLLKNYGSVRAAQNGYINEKQIPVPELNMVVDTRTVMILLPQDEVEKLKLKSTGKVIATWIWLIILAISTLCWWGPGARQECHPFSTKYSC